jgi:hypothetical protein
LNRQSRRRAEREGKKELQWDIIIPSILVVAVLLIFIGNYLFPNLNLETYAGASPRIMRKIGDRGIQRLRQDWPEIESFSYGDIGENTYYTVEKKGETWAFTELETEATIDYATNNLPDYYVDMPDALDQLAAVLHDKSFEIGFQQTTDYMNVILLMKTTENEDELQEQYMLVFNKQHSLDRIYKISSQAEEVVGFAFSDIYPRETEVESTNP